MIKVGEIELSKTSDIFIMDALVKTIENNFNDFSIIFSFDDVLMTILSDILFTQYDVDLLFSQTSLFKETIINNKFKVHNLSELNHLLELNQTYRILFN